MCSLLKYFPRYCAWHMVDLHKHTANGFFYFMNVKDLKKPLGFFSFLPHASGEMKFSLKDS